MQIDRDALRRETTYAHRYYKSGSPRDLGSTPSTVRKADIREKFQASLIDAESSLLSRLNSLFRRKISLLCSLGNS